MICAALFEQQVNGFDGAPQSVYSDHFLETEAIDGPMGYKLEVPPLHPVLFSTTMQGFGVAACGDDAAVFRTRTRCSPCCATASTEQSPGGTVQLNSDGWPVLDYR